jgi:hypothetical protein
MVELKGGVESPLLTPKQRERYNYLYAHFDHEANLRIVFHISSRGPNSWKEVQPKIEGLKHASYIEQEFNDGLYEEFDLSHSVMFDDIVRTVCDVRSNLKLPLYRDRIKLQCLQAFLNLFIVEAIYSDPANKRSPVIGYKPIISLKPE